MFDVKLIRDNPEFFDAGWKVRGLEPQTAEILKIDDERKAVISELQELQTKRNETSKQIGVIKSQGGDASEVMKEVASFKDKMANLEDEERNINRKLTDVLCSLPNIPHKDVPQGDDEEDNVEVKVVGDIPKIDNPKEHYEIGEALGMDFETAAKMSGSRFVLLKGQMARMKRAIAQYMLDTHTRDHGYTEVHTPLLVRAEALYGTGQLPKFEEDLFKTTTDHYLIPTSEVPLTNVVMNETLNADDLPMRMTAHTPCFRSEAGSAGKDTRGMIRQHQFYKVEMVSIVDEDTSYEELERMLGCAEKILQGLELPYKVVTLCSGDLGFGAHKTYDIEVWLPGQDTYREISSCSNCGDFQARRMKAKYKASGEKQAKYVHTLNGSGLAVGRTLVAILENYQQPDGSVLVPKALHPYMGGVTKLEAAK